MAETIQIYVLSSDIWAQLADDHPELPTVIDIEKYLHNRYGMKNKEMWSMEYEIDDQKKFIQFQLKYG